MKKNAIDKQAFNDILNKRKFNESCYKTKEDRKTGIYVNYKGVSQDRWDSIFGKHTKHFERTKQPKQKTDKAFGNVSVWNPEWTFLSTGKRMTKRQLKDYCKQYGKVMC